MSRNILFIGFNFWLFVAGCVAENARSDSKKSDTNESTEKSDSLNYATDTSIVRADLFERLVHRMDSLGYDPDTTYFDEKMYQDGKIHYSNYETNYVHEVLINEGNYGDLTNRVYDKKYDLNFSKVKDIKIYPWRMADTLGKRRDGEVQNWVFENRKDAFYVFDFLEYEKRNNGFPFINKESYYFLFGNEVFIFNTFDENYETRQIQFYNWVKKESGTY